MTDETEETGTVNVPTVRIYQVKTDLVTGWWYRIVSDETPVGPFSDRIEAGRASREEIMRRCGR